MELTRRSFIVAGGTAVAAGAVAASGVARADEAASERLLGQPQDFQKRLLEKAAKVTPEQLREVARKYLLVDKMYEVTLLP